MSNFIPGRRNMVGGREQCLTMYKYVHNTLESELLISQSEYLPIL